MFREASINAWLPLLAIWTNASWRGIPSDAPRNVGMYLKPSFGGKIMTVEVPEAVDATKIDPMTAIESGAPLSISSQRQSGWHNNEF